MSGNGEKHDVNRPADRPVHNFLMSSQRSSGSVGHSKHRKVPTHGPRRRPLPHVVREIAKLTERPKRKAETYDTVAELMRKRKGK